MQAEKENLKEISSFSELKAITDDLDGNYILTKSIDLSETEWDPIGSDMSPFTGTLNGNGYVIKNMSIRLLDKGNMEVAEGMEDNGSAIYAGLFGSTSGAVIENLALSDIQITYGMMPEAYIGGIVGKAENSRIDNCYVSGSISILDNASCTVGGIAGTVYQWAEAQETGYNLLHNFSRILITGHGEIGKTGTLAGYMAGTSKASECYSDNEQSSLFGTEIQEESRCIILDGKQCLNPVFYIGFDFENIWTMTESGAKLIRQAEEDSAEETISPNVDDSTDEDIQSEDTLEPTNTVEDLGWAYDEEKFICGDFIYTVVENNAIRLQNRSMDLKYTSQLRIKIRINK